MRKLVLSLLLLTALPALARTPFPPVDEAARDPSFGAFRAKLVQIVERRDAEALLAVVAPDIHFSFGDESSKEGFAKEWKLSGPDPKSSKLWPELGRVLSLGGTLGKDNVFRAPYVSSKWPDGKDPVDYVAIVTRNEKVHASPSAGSKVVYTASHEILKNLDTEERKAWVKVEFGPGKSGYVRAAAVHGPIDYRAFFAKAKDGSWRMKTFIAGD